MTMTNDAHDAWHHKAAFPQHWSPGFPAAVRRINVLLKLFFGLSLMSSTMAPDGLIDGASWTCVCEFEFVRIEHQADTNEASVSLLLAMGLLLGQIHNNYHDIHPPLVVDMYVSQVAISEVRSQASLRSGVVIFPLRPYLQSTPQRANGLICTAFARHFYSLLCVSPRSGVIRCDI